MRVAAMHRNVLLRAWGSMPIIIALLIAVPLRQPVLFPSRRRAYGPGLSCAHAPCANQPALPHAEPGTPGKRSPPGSFRNPEESSFIGLVLVLDSIADKRQAKSISMAGAALGDLQIEGYAFAVDEHRSRVQELLPGAIVLLVAAQRGKGKEKFHGFGYRGR